LLNHLKLISSKTILGVSMSIFSRFGVVKTVTVMTVSLLLIALGVVELAVSANISKRIQAQAIESQNTSLRTAATIVARDLPGTTVSWADDGNVKRIEMESIPTGLRKPRHDRHHRPHDRPDGNDLRLGRRDQGLLAQDHQHHQARWQPRGWNPAWPEGCGLPGPDQGRHLPRRSGDPGNALLHHL
jgi:hypothetical protein